MRPEADLHGIDSPSVDFVASRAESVFGEGGFSEGRDKGAPTPEGQWGSEGSPRGSRPALGKEKYEHV